MGFLDKLLGRAKDTAGDVSDKAAPVVDKAQDSAGQAWDKATDVAGDAADKVEDAGSGLTDRDDAAAENAPGTPGPGPPAGFNHFPDPVAGLPGGKFRHPLVHQDIADLQRLAHHHPVERGAAAEGHIGLARRKGLAHVQHHLV